MNIPDKTVEWLLQGDPSIQFQTHLDLLGINKPLLQRKISKEGWGKRFLDKQNRDGHWGQKFYQPKWISTHYTLLDLKNLGVIQNLDAARKTIDLVLKNEKGPDGGILPIGKDKKCDVCLNGMFLNYAVYFKADKESLKSIVDFILGQEMPDGGFNCQLNRIGARHSSLHSTLSVIEGIAEYDAQGYKHKIGQLRKIQGRCEDFILQHHLFISDRTGKIIQKDFLKLNYPDRWRYNILRALDYFQKTKRPYDARMSPSVEALLSKRRKDGRWNVQAHHPGKQHFLMEKAGTTSRWNTLRALRVLKHLEIGL